jgi:RNA polymerase sigma-70 factor (sigma-E family)
VKATGRGEALLTEGTDGMVEIEAAGSQEAGSQEAGSQEAGSEEAGSEEAGSLEALGFAELAGASRPTLVRAAHNVTGRHEDAEDAVQSSLLKAMRAWPRVAGQEKWRQQAYVRQIVVNTCRSGWRKWGSRVAIGDVPELAHASETDAVDDRELLRQALSRLPARQREVLLLRYYEDLTEAEIAKRLGCAPGTVKSSAARALRALRDMLPEYASRMPGADASTHNNAGDEAEAAPAAGPDAPRPSGPEVLKSA